MGLTALGYVVAGSTTLALALLLVGGRSYAASAAALFLVALFCVARGVRGTERGRDSHRPRPSESDDREEDDDRREKEAEAEKTRYHGGVG